MTMTNGFVRGDASILAGEDLALLDRRERVLGPSYRLFYENPLHIVRGEGVWLFDSEGRRYLDAYNNVASIGHCHPAVVEAVARQMAILNTHTRYLHEGIVAYAEALLRTLPAQLGNVMLTCTGSEANDLALRMARAATGGTGIIVTDTAYHGVTTATAALSPSLGPSNPLGADIWTVSMPESDDPDGVGNALLASVEAALRDMRNSGVRPAALLVDTIFSSDGVRTDPPGFLRGAVDAVRQAGGLLIADEVQAGFGRTGEQMWGFARHGVVPDLVTMGKPMGNGHPVAGVVARPEHAEVFGKSVRYFNTFGGNPVSSAAAMAVLNVIQKDRLQENSAIVGARLKNHLRTLANHWPALGEIRGSGLFVGVDVLRDGSPSPDDAIRIVNAMRKAGVLISATGRDGNVLKIRPPLVLETAQADMIAETLAEVVARLDQ